MVRHAALACGWILVVAGIISAAEPVIVVTGAPGPGSPTAVPVEARVDLAALRLAGTGDLQLQEITSSGRGAVLPAQFVPDHEGSSQGTLWWLLPPGEAAQRRFRLSRGDRVPGERLGITHDKATGRVEIVQVSNAPNGDPAKPQPVLRYNFHAVPVPKGTPDHFAEGESYRRSDYIHPLFGPWGEVLTDDYPHDHPHHRGVWWSWPVTRFGDQLGDIWAVVNVWSRPVAILRRQTGPVVAVLEAQNRWHFGPAETPIVDETVLIRAFCGNERGRFVDVEVRLLAVAEGVSIGGRPNAGYGGFSLRAAPCQDRRIVRHVDDTQRHDLPRSWLDYSGRFAGTGGASGITIFEHVGNPDYPNPLHAYPGCNCVMPAFPADREVPLSTETHLVLKHRLWIHSGLPDDDALGAVWASYAEPPAVAIQAE